MILIIGRTGSGKDYLAQELAKSGLTQVLSYTTRPQRYPEENTHIFIDKVTASIICDMIATTTINGYEYFATRRQMEENDVYIIDPAGTYELLKNCPSVPFVICYVTADNEQRQMKAVGRGSDSSKEAEVFLKRNASENEQFSEFEAMLIDPVRLAAFRKQHPNIGDLILVRNDYEPTTIQGAAQRLLGALSERYA